jgi:hypothetical protein
MASSFECDGCGHHASFHNMENSKDDAVVKRWQEAEKGQQQAIEGPGPRKRPREAIENGGGGQSVQQLVNGNSTSRRVIKAAARARSTRQQRQSISSD